MTSLSPKFGVNEDWIREFDLDFGSLAFGGSYMDAVAGYGSDSGYMSHEKPDGHEDK